MHYKELTSLHHTTVTGLIDLPNLAHLIQQILESKISNMESVEVKKRYGSYVAKIAQNGPIQQRIFSPCGVEFTNYLFFRDSIHLRHLHHKYAIDTYVTYIFA